MAAKLTFFGSIFVDEDAEQRLTYTVTVDDGDYQGVIDVVKDDGGTLIPRDDGSYWFLPWPPAAIKIEMT